MYGATHDLESDQQLRKWIDAAQIDHWLWGLGDAEALQFFSVHIYYGCTTR